MTSELARKITADPEQWLVSEIQQVIEGWLANEKTPDYWRTPLAAMASADDPLMAELKRAVAPDHALPRDLLADARSVIVFFLPFQQWLGLENDQTRGFAARSWAQAYVVTNRLIQAVTAHLQTRLEEAGERAAVTPATHNFDEARLVSRWSHKHLAYIAGLGRFGHHHLLITRAGCCGRLGSLVTTMELPATARPDEEWCLALAGRQCLECVSKCRYQALDEDGFDRHACYRQLLKNDKYFADLPLVDVCGKCGAQVPCSYEIPRSEPGAESGPGAGPS